MDNEPVEQPVADSTPEERLEKFFGADASEPGPTPEGPQEASASDEPEQPEVEEGSGYEEIELDGETYRVPPKLKDAVLRQSDYTQKTQQVAEIRRAVEAQARAVQLVQQFQAATADEQRMLQALESKIGEYNSVDWQNLDSETLIKAKHNLDTLKERATEVRARLSYKAQQAQQAGSQLQEQFKAQRAEALQRIIPGWNGEADYYASIAALNVGFAPDEVANNFDARMGILAWKAAQFDRLQSGKSAAVQQVKKAPPVIKPGASQGQNVVAQKKYSEDRVRLKKSGSVDDAARLFMRMK